MSTAGETEEPATEEAEHNGDTCLVKSCVEAMRMMEGVLDKVKCIYSQWRER